MALFGKKKEEKNNEETVVSEKKTGAEVSAPVSADRNLQAVIVKPVITEKAAVVGEQNVYTFEVQRSASKYDVRDAVKALFKVTPIKINIVNKKPRTFVSRMRGRRGVHSGTKKAYVFLKKGDRIDLV